MLQSHVAAVTRNRVPSEKQRRSKQLNSMTMFGYFSPAALLIANAMSTVKAMSRSPSPSFCFILPYTAQRK